LCDYRGGTERKDALAGIITLDVLANHGEIPAPLASENGWALALQPCTQT